MTEYLTKGHLQRKGFFGLMGVSSVVEKTAVHLTLLPAPHASVQAPAQGMGPSTFKAGLLSSLNLSGNTLFDLPRGVSPK